MPISLRAATAGPRHKWWTLGTVAVGILMSTLDSGIVNVGLPTITAAFHTDLATVEWIVLAYLLTITILLLSIGRLADMLGRKQVYTAGFVVFTVGSALCGAAPTAEALIAFRVLQAVGASMLMANGMAITSAVFPPGERGKALGINGAVVATGTTVGPTLGGLLIAWLGWRSTFYVNVPIGIVGTALALYVLQEKRISAARSPGQRFDLAGALTAAVALLALLLALTHGQEWGWKSLPTLALLALFAALLTAFLAVEFRHPQPMLHLGLFRVRAFALGSLAACLSFLALSANAFLMPFYLQLILGYGPDTAGILMTPSSLTIALVAPLSGWLSDRVGARILSSLGLAVNCLALLSLSRLGPTATYGDVLGRLLLLGVGSGLFQSPNNSSVIGSVPRESYGVASGFVSMMRNLGTVTGVALAGAILMGSMAPVVGHAGLGALRVGGQLPAGQQARLVAAFIRGFGNAYAVGAGIAVFGVVASLIRGGVTSSPDRQNNRDEQGRRQASDLPT